MTRFCACDTMPLRDRRQSRQTLSAEDLDLQWHHILDDEAKAVYSLLVSLSEFASVVGALQKKRGRSHEQAMQRARQLALFAVCGTKVAE